MPVDWRPLAAVEVAGQREYDGGTFPLVLAHVGGIATLEESCRWMEAQAAELDRAAAQTGVVLLRGLPLTTDQDFDALVAASGWRNFPYKESLSNAVRINRTERVFTANEAPPEVAIYLHHEMAQTPLFPSKLFFFCERPADSGGATPVCRSDVVLRRLEVEHPQFVDDCRRHGLRYSNVMPPAADFGSGMGRSWQSTLRAESREEAEARLSELGYSGEWLDDGCLRATTPALPAVRKLPDGRETFFNQLIAAFQGWRDQRNDPSRAICLGDGRPLDVGAARRAAELGEEEAVNLAWQQGDVALVDNYVAMHGRRTFTGVRKVLASLIA